MDVNGSLEYELIWKEWDMRSGPPICALRGSARRTSGKGCTGWPTPMAGSPGTENYNAAGNTDSSRKTVALVAMDGAACRSQQTVSVATLKPENRVPHAPSAAESTPNVDAQDQLRTATNTPSATEPCTLAGWPTPNTMTGGQTSRGGDRKDELLMGGLVGWPTCSARDWKDTPGMSETGVNPDGSTRTRLDQLPRVAQLAPWVTPTANTPGGTPEQAIARKQDIPCGKVATCLNHQAQLASWSTPRAEDAGMRHNRGVADTLSAQAGQDLKSSTAGTEKRGVLNPDHSRWLMGYPAEWGCCGATAMQSCRKSRRSS
jgi:hypothetical protein